jgi:hypothetical protein
MRAGVITGPYFFLSWSILFTMASGHKTYFEKITGFLGSLKLSFILLLLLGLFVFQRAIIAQKSVSMEELPWFIRLLNSIGLDSPEGLMKPLIAILLFFVLNLVLSGMRMFRKVRAKQKVSEGFKTADALGKLLNHAEFDAPHGSEELIITHFRKDGFGVVQEDSDGEIRLRAFRHRTGFWGVVFFHLTFMVLLVGALLSIFTRYAGYVELSPGETFTERHENYKVVSDRPFLFSGDSNISLRLDDVELSYWGPGDIKQRASTLSVFDPGGTFIGKERMEVNRPLKVSGMNIYQGSRQGFIAELEAVDSEGNRAPGEVSFRIPDKPDGRMITRVNLPGTTLNLMLELFTEKLGEIEGLESYRSRHMATLIRVTSIVKFRREFKGVLFRGGSLSFEGITLYFIGLRPYSSLVAIRDYGVPVIFASFIPLLAGLVITYFWVPENYWAVIRKGEVRSAFIVGATSERFRESFREKFEDRIEKIKKEVSNT